MGHKSHNQELAEPGFKSRFFDSSPWCFYPITLSLVDLLGLWASKTCNSRPRSRTQLSKTQATQSRQTLCDPMDYTVCGILQARILEWVAFPFSKRSSQPRDWTQVSCITGGFFTNWAMRKAYKWYIYVIETGKELAEKFKESMQEKRKKIKKEEKEN